LDPSLPGLRKLAELGCTLQGKVRPRWKLKGGARGFTLYPAEVEKVKEAQQLLIELGPVLVEMKLLEAARTPSCHTPCSASDSEGIPLTG
jgi:hypothetical protein